MPWASMNAGKILAYTGDEGFVRICKAEDPYSVVSPPSPGPVWVLQACDLAPAKKSQNPTTGALLDIALSKIREGESPAWFLSPAEMEKKGVVLDQVLQAWASWKKAHPELNWQDDRLQVSS